MLYPLETLKSQLSNREQQLMYYMIVEQQETNRLLNILIGGKRPIEEEETVSIEGLKRPGLMKIMSTRDDAPQGWNKWANDKIIEFLKGEQ